MKKHLLIAFRYYKWMLASFVTGFAIYIVYDDYILIKKISSASEAGLALVLELWYLMAYSLIFSLLFWIVSLLIFSGYWVIRKFGKSS